MTGEAERLTGALLAGRYRLRRLLGEGGMGEVYEAEDRDGGVVAVKVLRAPDEELLARFSREAALTRSIRSPHVVEVLDFGRDEALHAAYLTMPLLDGRDVAALLDASRPVDTVAAVRLVRQACAGLAAAHALNVVHRDIKPANLFLVRGPANGEIVVRLLDFGIGKQVADVHAGGSLTRTGSVLGTPMYMSPEQLNNTKHVDARTDVFSLAVVLYELLSGEAPWAHLGAVSKMLVAVASKDAPPLHTRAPWIPLALSEAVGHALDRNVETRCQTAEELAELLLPFAGGDDALREDMLLPTPQARSASAFAETADGATSAPQPSGPGASTDPLLGQSLAGRYPVIRLLGRGGMGAVYEVESDVTMTPAKAVDAGAPARFAAKVVTRAPGLEDEAAHRRFLREARAATSIDSPHVVKTFELGRDERLGVPFILMELLEGSDLASTLRALAPLEPSAAVRIIRQAAAGLAAAHEKGIIHRDVKPANLFLSASRDGDLTVKVCDFGIAKPATVGDQSSQDLTRTGGVLGSPAYMSPEQAQSARSVDARSDVFSLSVCLWEALAGARAWEGLSSLGEIIVAICTKSVRPLSQVAPWVDPGLAKIVHKGLARDPAQRWGSVTEMSEALRPHAGAAPLTLADVRSVDAETRAQCVVVPVGSVPPPAEQPTIGVVTAPSAPAAPRPARTPWMPWALAAAAAVALAAGATALGARNQGGATVEGAATSPRAATASAASAAPRAVEVSIEPEDAEVRVDGKPRATAFGKLELTGAPGDAFQVQVTSGDQTTTSRVFVTSDGRAEPARIVAVASAAPIASGAALPSATAAPRGQRATGPARPTPTATAATPAPTARPAGAALPTKDDWK